MGNARLGKRMKDEEWRMREKIKYFVDANFSLRNKGSKPWNGKGIEDEG